MQHDQDLEDFKNLQAIFPNWNKESLLSVFESNARSLDVTVQSVLAIETARGGTENNNGSSFVQSKKSKNRGTPCVLPNDFLRPPGWTPKLDADEQLARNLQREISTNPKRTQNQTTATNNNLTKPLQMEPIPDLGIMKAISIFSEAAVKNMDLFVASVQDSVTAAASAAAQATSSSSTGGAMNNNTSTTGVRKTAGSINDDQNDNIWHDHDSDDDDRSATTPVDVDAKGDIITFDSPTRPPAVAPSVSHSKPDNNNTGEINNSTINDSMTVNVVKLSDVPL